MKKLAAPFLLLLTLCSPAWADRPAFKSKLNNIVASHPEWKTGVAVWFLEGGKVGDKVEIGGSEPRALASVFKVPVLVELARQIESKKTGLKLSSGLTISEPEKCIGSGRLLHQPAGTVVPVERLIELMETISDNTATDMLFRRIGKASVNKMLEEIGCKHSDIALTNRAAWLISLAQSSDFRGMSPVQIAFKWGKLSRPERAKAAERAEQENRNLSLSKFQRLEDESSRKQTHEQNVLVATTVDNQSSASDLALLLSGLYNGQLLGKEMTRYCLGVLGRQHFNTRIPRSLPSGTRVYHKTGTIAGVVNDIGIIEVPGQGAVVVVALVNSVGSGDDGPAESLIARVARAAYDELVR